MSKFIFIFINILLQVLRVFLAIPIILLRNFSGFIRKRLDFERRNLFSQASRPFLKNDKVLKADYLFHVSSEGELEQARPLMESFLKVGSLIEIIFTSESVEDKCEKLYFENPHQVRIFRLPILSYFPFSFLYFQSIYSFITADIVIMCRYDFFPELLFLKFYQKRLFLISAATKKLNWWKQNALSFFELFVAATSTEAKNLNALMPDASAIAFDFRIPRIFYRLKMSEDLFQQNPHTMHLINEIKAIPRNQKIIFGSLWKSDLAIFHNDELKRKILANEITLFICPHKLSRDFVEELSQFFNSQFKDLVSEWDGKNAGVLKVVNVITIPGILCELYQFFNISYVGGGYEKSIHSVLEPFLMGSKVLVGPKVHRSTEYDFVKDLKSDEIIVLKNPESFYNEYIALNKDESLKSLRQDLKLSADGTMAKIIEQISKTKK